MQPAAGPPASGTGTTPASATPQWAAASARRLLERHWQPSLGYTAPNRARYRWQWLWDSCFHAVIWAALDDERAVVELETLFALQDPSGLVPHIGYQADPEVARSLWGRAGSSTLTQPPMWGHAMAVMAGRGFTVDHLAPAATAGLRFLLEHRRAPCGLVRIVHPWESGADDSARWDAYCPGGFDRARWLDWKLAAVGTLVQLPGGAAVGNPAFDVCPVSFNALVAFNCLELGILLNDDGLLRWGRELGGQVADRWSAADGTWVDVDPTGRPVGADDTLDALLATLVDHRPDRLDAAVGALTDERRFAAPFGPCALSRSHPAFDPRGYWRGPSWPQLTYLLQVAASRAGRTEVADGLAALLRRTAAASGLAEYVDPLTGDGLGAVPQSWAGLCAVPAVVERPPQ